MVCCMGTLLLFINLQAQERGHYLFLETGMGPTAIECHLKNGNQIKDVGYQLTVGYGYFFHPNWGVETGLGIQTFHSQIVLSSMSGYSSVDKSGIAYEYRNYFNGWQEKQNFTLLSIPVGLRGVFPVFDHLGLTASGGVKLLMPVSSTYAYSDGSITTTGYYSSTNMEFMNQPQNGFTTINQVPSGKIHLGLSYAGYADIGVVCQLTPVFSVNVGTYVDYGPSNWINPQKNLVYQSDGHYNDVMHSDRVTQNHYLSYGLKLGFSWYLGDKSYGCHCSRD